MSDRLSFPAFLNFWTYYKGQDHQKEAIEKLWRAMPQELLDQTSDWVVSYRSTPKPEPEEITSVINDAGLRLIKSWEGLRLEAYLCPAGVWTIGYGSTGPHVYQGLTITEKEAEDLLRKDLFRFEDAVSRMVRYPLTDNEYAALVSWTFNLGQGALADSTLLRRLNLGEQPSIVIQQEFPKWVYANGKRLQGLVNRRQAEIDLAVS